MAGKKSFGATYLPLSLIILIVIGGSVFYFYNVVRQNKIGAENIKIERTINEISSCHISYLTAVKEKRGFQITRSSINRQNYLKAKNAVSAHLQSLHNTFLSQQENTLYKKYESFLKRRFVELDSQLSLLNRIKEDKFSSKNNTTPPISLESGNDEEALYETIIVSLENRSSLLSIVKNNIEKYNYAGFILLILLIIFLVVLNLQQIRKLLYRRLRREREKEMLSAIKASEEEFSAAFEYASIGIALVGVHGEWLRVNKSLCNMLGYTNAELMLCTFQDITHEDDLEIDLAFLKQLADGEIPTYQMAKRYYTKTGDIIWINLSVSKVVNADGSVKHFISQIENINDKKLAEIALNNEKERLANVLDGTNAGTWELNIQTGVTVYNERWANIAGYTLKELEPISLNTWRELVHPDDLKKSDEKLLACFEENETYYECECRLKHKDGYYVWVLDRGKVISRTEEGKPLLISGTQIDISGIKNAEQAVKEKQALLETLLNSIDVGIVACDAEGEITIINKATQTLYGLPANADLAKDISNYFELLESDGSTALTPDKMPWHQALQYGQVYTEEITMLSKDGNKRIVKCSGNQIKDENGNVYGAVVALQDVTQQRTIEKLLALNEKRFRGIFNATHQLMGFLDMEGNVVETNDTSLKFAGANAEEVIGKKFWDGPWWYHSKAEQAKLQAAFNDARAGKFVQYETTHINAEGKLITLIFNLKPLFDDAGNVIAVIPEGRPIQDIADARKRLQEKNEELQQFAALASHDLKEPLRMVKSFMQLLQKNYATQLDEKANKYIDFAVDGAERMSTFIRDLLAYSNTGSDEIPKEKVNTQELVNDVVAMQKAVLAEKNASIIYQNLPTIVAHKTPLALVLQNLINNAVKYQQADTTPVVKITAEEKNDYWQFAVKDNGIGIEDQYLIKIFDLFKRLHVRGEYSGTGMGLATCKKIVQQHGGSIWATSKVGEGSTFYFTFTKPI